LNCAVKLVVLAVLATVVVVLVAPSVDLPESTEIRSGIANVIVAAVDTIAVALPAVPPAAPQVLSGCNDSAVFPGELTIPVTDLCCARLC
jgi:hypothetical protein